MSKFFSLSYLRTLRGQTFWIPIVLILVFWSILYLPHLRTSPAWYGDETLTLMIGKSLFKGEVADRALKATFWHPSYTYQPGYAWLVGAAAFCAGGDILGARFFNVLLALAIALTMYFAGRRIIGHRAACFAALLFLSYEQTVIHFRWIYPHNALALGFTIAILFLGRKSRPRPDWIAGFGLAIGALSHPLFAHGAIAAWICRIRRPVAWFRLAIPPAIALVVTMGLLTLRYWPHHWIFQDITTLGAFYRTSGQDGSGDFSFSRNVLIFFTQDIFHFAAFLCAFLCLRRRMFPIAVFIFVVSGLLLQNRQNLTVFYYQAIVFLPALALACGGGLRVGTTLLRRINRESRTARAVELCALVIPLWLMISLAPASLSGTLRPRNFPWVTQNIAEVEAAAAWINHQVSPQDLVICHQNIGWLLKCHTADFMQATAWSGLPTFTFEKPVDRDRFLYPADLDQARFVVVGDIDQRWTFSQPNIDKIALRLENGRWPVVWKGPYYLIFQNPKFGHAP